MVIESLAAEFDVMDVALGAVKLAHLAASGDLEGDEEEIPAAQPEQRAEERPERRRPQRPRGPSAVMAQ